MRHLDTNRVPGPHISPLAQLPQTYTTANSNKYFFLLSCKKTKSISTHLISSFFFAITLNITPVYAECFGPSDSSSPIREIYQNAIPPASSSSTYKYYPVKYAATQQINKLSPTQTGVKSYAWVWVNHTRSKGNGLIPPYYNVGSEVRALFTTIQRANACTKIQLMRIFNESSIDLNSIAIKYGLQLASRSEELSWRVNSSYLTNVCILSDYTLPSDTEGVLFDYEVQDGRSNSQTTSFLSNINSYVHEKGKKTILYLNPLDGPSQISTGIDSSNAPILRRRFDKMTVLLWSGNKQQSIKDSFYTQIRIAGLDFYNKQKLTKIIIAFELADTSLEDARIVHNLMKKSEMENLMFWRNGAVVGGSCETDVNKKIACLAFSRCKW
jgi:hypothetical protein